MLVYAQDTCFATLLAGGTSGPEKSAGALKTVSVSSTECSARVREAMRKVEMQEKRSRGEQE